MKLKHIIPFFIAALAFAVVSCSEDDEKTYLDGLSVSQSFVGLDTLGTPVQVTVSANADWAFEKIFTQIVTNEGSKDTIKTETPEWLTVDKVSGPAGETVITFSAEKATETQEAELKITSAGMTQFIKVIQTVEGGEQVIITVKEAIEMVKANQQIEKTIIVKGIVCRIDEISPQYGNATYYLSDDGSYSGKYSDDGSGDANWIEVYRGRWIENAKFTTGDEFTIGDELVVSGIIYSYKGIPEFKQGASQVVSHSKSLIKVDSLSIEDGVLPHEGGDITVFLSNKGNGIIVDVPEDAKEWLSIMGITTNSVKFHVAANTGAARKTSITFKTTDGEKEYTSAATISQKAFAVPHGQDVNDPYTVAEVLEFTKALDSNAKSDFDVYVKGKISSIKYTYSAQYGTATYNISDDGNEENVFIVYGSYYLDNQPWKDGDEQIEVGDEVLVCGKVINYNGTTPEFASKENHLVSIKKASNPEPGTLENPFTVAQVLEAAGKLNGDEKEVSAEDYYIKGKISKIKFTFSAQYGTAQFHISADGAEEGDQFLIYGTYYLGNQPWVEGNTQIAVGDEVIICGKITNYNGTLETANKKSYIYSLNGQTE